MSVMMKLLTPHHFLTLSIILEALVVYSSAQKFDPYQLNGGLVAAVAGKDYVLIASDTRLTDGGYGVHSRRYLSGRLWSASSASSTTTSTSVATAVTNDSVVSSSSNGDAIGDGDKKNIIITTRSNNNLLQSPSTIHCWDSDGSLLLPSTIQNKNIIISTNAHAASLLQHESSPPPPTTTTTITNPPPIIIGSAGCASDCESLKRRMRLELDAFDNNNIINNHNLCVSSVANLLQQILYSRRGFPFYSFCVVAGLIPPSESLLGGGGGGSGRKKRRRVMEGAVYVYDAIGSYERVAVGSAGTGRELLQPILDQLFSGSATTAEYHDDNGGDESILFNNDNHSNNGKSGDILAIPPMKQRVGVAGSLRPPVPTTVRCTVEDAVRNVARAYQSVAEREISVGDEVVICVVRSATATASSSEAVAAVAAGGEEELVEGAVLKVYRYPLKKH